MRTSIRTFILSLFFVACVVDAGADRAAQATPPAPSLEYVERVTGGAEKSERVPTVIAIHGLGDTPEGFARVFDSLPEKARLIYPRGPLRHGGGFAWTKHRARGGDERAFAADLSLRVAELAQLLTHLARRSEVEAPFVVTGFSQGGFLSFALTLAHPSLVRAAFPIGGGLPPSLRAEVPEAPEGSPRIVAFHGEADRLVPHSDALTLVEWLRGRGWRAELRGYAGVGHTVSPAMRRALHAAIVESLPTRATSPDRGSPQR